MHIIKTTKTLIASAFLVAAAGTASAATIYADSVVDHVQGSCTDGGLSPVNGNGCAVDRSDPLSATGAPDGSFFSLGDGGHIELGFADAPFANGVGSVYEITNNRTSDHDEAAEVFAGFMGVYTSLGIITNDLAMNSVLLFGNFDTIKIVDVTQSHFGTTTSFDGFDVDSVGISAVPLPATALMLLMGLGGFAAVRRKKA